MIKFGTGGWRAIIGEDFIKANIQILAKAMADKMIEEGVQQKGIVIGYDRRFLSRETVVWCCEVFAAAGITCHFVCRSVPTPLIMNHVMKYEFPYGMMVTASHNTSLYNGIKIFTAGGRDANEEQTRDIEKYIEKVQEDTIPKMDYDEARTKRLVREIYPMNEYVDDIMAKINIDAIRDAHLRIVLDPMYGVSETALGTILITGRCDLDVIHEQHDTLFGGKMPAPSAERLQMLRTQVLDKKYDMGLATDGDADRLGVIDDKGNYLHPNDILVLLYYYLVKYKGWKGPVVRNLATTHRLDEIAKYFGEKCFEVPVGFKHISAKMAESCAIIGGESSGGLTVAGHIKGKDGVYAATLLVEMVAVTGKKLSELMQFIKDEFGTCYMEERAFSFSQELKENLIKQVFNEKKLPDMTPFNVRKISYMDGCKVYFENGGWLLIRFSGTEPTLRVFCEMPDMVDAIELCDRVKKYFHLE